MLNLFLSLQPTPVSNSSDVNALDHSHQTGSVSATVAVSFNCSLNVEELRHALEHLAIDTERGVDKLDAHHDRDIVYLFDFLLPRSDHQIDHFVCET